MRDRNVISYLSQGVLVPALAPIQPLPLQVILNMSASPGSIFVQMQMQKKKKKVSLWGRSRAASTGLGKSNPSWTPAPLPLSQGSQTGHSPQVQPFTEPCVPASMYHLWSGTGNKCPTKVSAPMRMKWHAERFMNQPVNRRFLLWVHLPPFPYLP